MTVLPVYIGYDESEHEAFDVCRLSLERRASRALHITRLDQSALRTNGWYKREWRRDADGRKIDLSDGKPFSTDFSFTRFLVPALTLYQGWALYCDCDFLFTADIGGLLVHADPQYAALCVKHQHEPSETTKMSGEAQSRYFRKNWSSLVLWNCEHPANRSMLSPHMVNCAPGSWLHAFRWLRDEQIGELPVRWNWLSGVNKPLDNHEVPSAIHYTLGVPTLHENCERLPFAQLWISERGRRTLRAAA